MSIGNSADFFDPGFPTMLERTIAEEEFSPIAQIISLKTHCPDFALLSSDKLSNTAFTETKNGALYGKRAVKVGMEKRGSKKEINTFMTIKAILSSVDGQNGIEISGEEKLTAYDRIVYDAITTLYIEGDNEYITPKMIFHAMIGNPDKTITPKQVEAINRSITKMMYSRITIDASQEAEMYKNLFEYKYDGMLLPAERITVKLNGTKTVCIHLFRDPPLYDYASRKRQVCKINMDILDLDLNKNEMTILIQYYLLRRILAMKSPKNRQSNVILYDALYQMLGADAASRKAKLDIRKKAKDILDYWKEKKFIVDYEEEKKWKTPRSLAIIYSARGRKKKNVIIGDNVNSETSFGQEEKEKYLLQVEIYPPSAQLAGVKRGNPGGQVRELRG